MVVSEPVSDVVRRLAEFLAPGDVQVDARVARYTTWRVGGPARLLCVVRDGEELRRAVETVRAAGLSWIVIGRGSNVLVDDAGVEGAVIVNRADALTIEGATVRAESGVLLGVLARRTVGAGLLGLEWCHDIPGSVGGAVVNNAGANGGAMADALRSVRLLPVEGDAREELAEELHFGYRRSALRREEPVRADERPVVLGATFELARGEVAAIKERMGAQRERRKRTQPGGASAGSTFKNPEGDSAGRLVESLGLKGYTAGDAAISTLHANFIVCGPRATAAAVLALVAHARRRVLAERGVALESEIQYVYRDGRVGPPPLKEIGDL
jgi:UDP-N-acetylmuramate dehydrogenase